MDQGWGTFQSIIITIQQNSSDFCFILQILSRVRLFKSTQTAAHQDPLSFTISQSLLKSIPTEPVTLSHHLILCHCLLLLPSIFPSFKVFSNDLALHIWWPKCWSFTISSSNEHSGLISLRIDWFNFLLVQRILKALLQHPNLKASVLWCSAFSMIQLSHPYMTTGKKTQL